MITTGEIIETINAILAENENRIPLIRSLQSRILNDDSTKDESLNEILNGLAYDLNFYDPDEVPIEENKDYYGSKRLEEILNSALRKLTIK